MRRRHQHQRRLRRDLRPGRACAVRHRRRLDGQSQRNEHFRDQGAGASGIVASLGGVDQRDRFDVGHDVRRRVACNRFRRQWRRRGRRRRKGQARRGDDRDVGPGRLRAHRRATRRRAGPPARSRSTGALNIRRPTPPRRRSGFRATARPFSPTGGGTITSAGNAIEFLGGSGQTATFDNFTINNLSGDLVFADPSTATVNFNSTTANAGSNNLLNATNGSAITSTPAPRP